jgi:hypothetical protein
LGGDVRGGTIGKARDRAGGSRQHLFNASAPVIGIHSDANLLFVNYSESLYANVTSLNKTNGND